MGPWPLLAPVATPAAVLSLISLFVLSFMVWLCNVFFLFLLVLFQSIVGLVYKLSSLHGFIILINLYRFIQGKEKKKKTLKESSTGSTFSELPNDHQFEFPWDHLFKTKLCAYHSTHANRVLSVPLGLVNTQGYKKK